MVVQMKLYDVIIPVFNGEKTIVSTIKSIENSGLRDFSILIIDDGSTDATDEKCRLVSLEYDNIHYYRQANRGVSAARNYGMELADAKYIILFDADDNVDSGAFSKVNQIIEECNPDMLIYGMGFDYYHKGRLFRTDYLVYEQEVLFSQDELQEHFVELYQVNAFTSSCNKIIRRELLVQNHIFYDESYFLMEDFLFSLDCIKVCKKIYMLPEVIYRYRQSEDEGNVYRRIRKIESLSDYIKGFQERLTDHPDVLSDVYYMMLRQKLWLSKKKEIQRIAVEHVKSGIPAYKPVDKILEEELRAGNYMKIRYRNIILQVRHRIANVIKASKVYQELKKEGKKHSDIRV